MRLYGSWARSDVRADVGPTTERLPPGPSPARRVIPCFVEVMGEDGGKTRRASLDSSARSARACTGVESVCTPRRQDRMREADSRKRPVASPTPKIESRYVERYQGDDFLQASRFPGLESQFRCSCRVQYPWFERDMAPPQDSTNTRWFSIGARRSLGQRQAFAGTRISRVRRRGVSALACGAFPANLQSGRPARPRASPVGLCPYRHRNPGDPVW